MSIYAGAVAPQSYILNLTPASGVDLSTVTAADLSVLRPDGREVTWEVTMSNQTAGTLTLSRNFAPGDLDIEGDYILFARLTLPAGMLPSRPRVLPVLSKYSTAA